MSRRQGSRSSSGWKPLASSGIVGLVVVIALAVGQWLSEQESSAPQASTDPAGPSATVAPTASAGATASPHAVTALEALEALQVKGRAAKTGYSRDLFEWRQYDFDGNGCDTRNDILGRDLSQVTYKAGTRDCVVQSGVLDDPFTGVVMNFERGDTTSNLVQIDHVVALYDAWQKGAQAWEENVFREFGNDPLNLLAVEGGANQNKGHADAASWLPANKGFRCEYVARQIAVKAKYELWVTSAEKDAMTRVLNTCPEQPLPE